jgi:L-lactate dehydrogenase complex protein LldG
MEVLGRTFAHRRRYEAAQKLARLGSRPALARRAHRGAPARAAQGLDGRPRPAGAAGAELPRLVAGEPVSDARAEVLGRIRRALAGGGAPAAAGATAPTAAPSSHGPAPLSSQAPDALLGAAPPPAPASLPDRFAERVEDYRARVHTASADTVADLVAGICETHGPRAWPCPTGSRPPGSPARWSPSRSAPSGPEEIAALDAVDGVLTTCALAIAETGTIVLDAGPGQGPARRLAAARPARLRRPRRPGGPGVDEAVAALEPAVARLRRPLTWISGPSATSDIELDRVEGVHGPRRLEVVLVL